MKFISTRNQNIPSSLSTAIRQGLAHDGGLFVPETLPQIDFTLFPSDITLQTFSFMLLQHFFIGDELEAVLEKIIHAAFTFDVPLKAINHNTFVLELFHGPTLSFKDFGSTFFAECLTHLAQKNDITIMVATSGDTGSAVASAFYLKSNFKVIVLYPKGQISERQQQQITHWGHNIFSLAVNGSFDDCQAMVKAAFNDDWWLNHMHLNSANSINIARLLPQMIYYAYTSLQFYYQNQQKPGFIVPTGNLGNAVACYWAKKLGFPIREIVLATNANHALADYLKNGIYHPRPRISTLANAMDVGNPSNFERLRFLFKDFATFKQNVTVLSANDEDISLTIKTIYKQSQYLICPHTATAFFARQSLSEHPWIAVATAHPSKFNTVIEPIIGESVPIPSQLQVMLTNKTHREQFVSTLEEVKELIVSG